MTTKITVQMKPVRKYAREPYAQYKNHPAWKVLDRAIEDLVENQDLVETTVRKCIIGYLIKRLVAHGLLKDPVELTKAKKVKTTKNII